MKIIDLFVKIAHGEEVPEKIIFRSKEFVFNKSSGHYENWERNNRNFLGRTPIGCLIIEDMLNDEIEIIKDKPKKIDPLVQYSDDLWHGVTNEQLVIDKIEELRNATNYLLKRVICNAELV